MDATHFFFAWYRSRKSRPTYGGCWAPRPRLATAAVFACARVHVHRMRKSASPAPVALTSCNVASLRARLQRLAEALTHGQSSSRSILRVYILFATQWFSDTLTPRRLHPCPWSLLYAQRFRRLQPSLLRLSTSPASACGRTNHVAPKPLISSTKLSHVGEKRQRTLSCM